MRIIAGRFGGRRLEVPKNFDIRPTSDKVRGSIFNALNARLDLDGLHVMDLCCGTGAMGIEALSRGAQDCIFVDKSRESLELAKRNATTMEQGLPAHFILTDSGALRARTPDVQPIDLFFCDPPYAMDLITPSLDALLKGDWLAEDAYGVLEAEKGWPASLPESFDILSEKLYGDTKVVLICRS